MTASAVSRRWFRFSLKTLLVLVTILGSFLGWFGVQLRWIHDRREALRWIIDIRARQLARDSGSLVPPEKGVYVSHAGITAPWSLGILGESGVERLEVYQDWLNPDARYSLNELRVLFPEAEVIATTQRRREPRRGEWLIRLPTTAIQTKRPDNDFSITMPFP
jgi:hypothetical protein